jgi:hypothetical protein
MEIVTTPGPLPVEPLVIFTQLTGLEAFQKQPEVALTLICCVFAVLGTVSVDGETDIPPGAKPACTVYALVTFNVVAGGVPAASPVQDVKHWPAGTTACSWTEEVLA